MASAGGVGAAEVLPVALLHWETAAPMLFRLLLVVSSGSGFFSVVSLGSVDFAQLGRRKRRTVLSQDLALALKKDSEPPDIKMHFGYFYFSISVEGVSV